MELENPLAAQQRLKEKESGYFSSLGFIKKTDAPPKQS